MGVMTGGATLVLDRRMQSSPLHYFLFVLVAMDAEDIFIPYRNFLIIGCMGIVTILASPLVDGAVQVRLFESRLLFCMAGVAEPGICLMNSERIGVGSRIVACTALSSLQGRMDRFSEKPGIRGTVRSVASAAGAFFDGIVPVSLSEFIRIQGMA